MAKHPPEVRAAVLAKLMEGQSITATAKEYNIPKGTVHTWKKHYEAGRKSTTEKNNRIAELLQTYLEESMITLVAQLRFIRNEEWLKKQHASDLGVLMGITTDKTVRLLEAVGIGDDSPDSV